MSNENERDTKELVERALRAVFSEGREQEMETEKIIEGLLQLSAAATCIMFDVWTIAEIVDAHLQRMKKESISEMSDTEMSEIEETMKNILDVSVKEGVMTLHNGVYDFGTNTNFVISSLTYALQLCDVEILPHNITLSDNFTKKEVVALFKGCMVKH